MAVNNPKLVYNDQIFNLFKGTGAEKNEALVQSVKIRFKCDWNNLPASMPYDIFLEMLEYFRQILQPHLGVAEGLEKIGYQMVESYFSHQGVAARLVGKTLGVEDTSKSFLWTRRDAYPFARHELDHYERGNFVYHVYDFPGAPAWIIGQLKASFVLVGLPDVKIVYQVIKSDEVIYHITWTPRPYPR